MISSGTNFLDVRDQKGAGWGGAGAGAGAGAEAEEGAERDGEEEERGAEGGAVATETDTARESSASRPRMVTGANLLALVTDGTATHSRGSASRSLDAIVNLGVGDEVD